MAGLAYLVVQMVLAATVHDGAGWEPLHRTAAVLMGEDAAPPGELSSTITILALLIHFTLAAVYGSFISMLVRACSTPEAVLRGVMFGAAVFLLNFWIIAPNAFPWFEQSRTWFTALNHLLFGATAAVCLKRIGSREPK